MFAPGAFTKGNPVIQLTNSSAVSWPTPPSAAVAPVAAIPALPASAQAGQQTQTGTQSGHGGQARAFPSLKGERHAAASDAAPLLPRESAAERPPAVEEQHAQALQRQAERTQARERERQAMEHLKDVLANAWQASAAVVDRALGREGSAHAETVPGSRSDTSPDLSQVAAALISRRIATSTGPQGVPLHRPVPGGEAVASPGSNAAVASEPVAAPDGAHPDVVAYDERGNSSFLPLETGSLISHRV